MFIISTPSLRPSNSPRLSLSNIFLRNLISLLPFQYCKCLSRSTFSYTVDVLRISPQVSNPDVFEDDGNVDGNGELKNGGEMQCSLLDPSSDVKSLALPKIKINASLLFCLCVGIAFKSRCWIIRRGKSVYQSRGIQVEDPRAVTGVTGMALAFSMANKPETFVLVLLEIVLTFCWVSFCSKALYWSANLSKMLFTAILSSLPNVTWCYGT